MELKEKNFDVIIIGSGISSLTCASLLTQIWQKRVLVLERHFKPGGFTHVFRRNAGNTYEWDVGLHYVGNMKEDKPPRALFDYITQNNVTWQQMPDPYDVFIFPDLRVELNSGEASFLSELIRHFPEEEAGIYRYVKDLKKAAGWFGRMLIAKNLPEFLKPVSWILKSVGAEYGRITTGAYLEKNFSNMKLRSVLASQWGDYGLPPGKSAFSVHAIIALHYMNGGYYPVGGSKTIADSIIPIIEAGGGKVLVNHKVVKVLAENGKAEGVQVDYLRKETPTEKIVFYAEHIISAVGAYATYNDLLPDSIDISFKDQIRTFEPGTASVTLYVGLKSDPKEINYHGGNLWIYDDFDHDETYAQRNNITEGKIQACYVSCPSAKNPKATAHTMELICFADMEPFAAWADQSWKKRGKAYETLKEKICLTMIDFVERRLPGFRNLIDYYELSTPLSTIHFTGHRGGDIYGLPATPERFRQSWLTVKTPVQNLYLTGGDIAIHGIVGAMMSGVLSTGVLIGRPWAIIRIFRRAMKYNKFLHSRKDIY